MADIDEAVCEDLKRTAKAQRTLYYSDLMRRHHISRAAIGSVVGEISEVEADHHRPLLSAIVVKKNTKSRHCPHGHPGGGFFGLTGVQSSLRRSSVDYGDPLSKNDKDFVVKEQERVWAFWRKRR